MFWTTLRIFLWKHWKCIQCAKFHLLINIALPILLPFALVYLMQPHENTYHPDKQFEEYETETMRDNYQGSQLHFAPNNSFTYKLMEKVRVKLHLLPENVNSFDTAAQLDDFVQKGQLKFEFSILFGDTSTKPNTLNYSILTVDDAFRTDQLLWNDYFVSNVRSSDHYIDSNFVVLQGALDEAFADELSGDTNDSARLAIEISKMPTDIRELFQYTDVYVPMMLLCWVYVFSLINMVLVPAVEEKESGIKEFLRIASSYSYMNMATFFVVKLVISLFVFAVALAIFSSYGLTRHFSMVLMVVLVVLFVVSIIAYSFMISVLFNSVFFAKLAGFLFYFGQLSVYLFPRSAFLQPILNNVLFVNGVWQLDDTAKRGVVFDCSQLFQSTPDTYSLFAIYLFLVMDTLIYLTLYYYFIEVFPGTYGTPKSFLFPFQRSFWCRVQVGQQPLRSDDAETLSSDNKTDVVVSVRGLTKEFRTLCGAANVAVKNLSMDIYRNQITVLLGHNGAGKTTTMSVISGIIAKTSGTIVVDGEDRVDAYRHKIGYCPQHNVFLPYFTIRDHLLFFGGLRGLSNREASNQASGLLGSLHLTHKANEFGKDLSGGMKRRLCLGNAIIGNTQIAILDEPSSGLDPESRRELWNILLEMRKNHTILITTHYMEEAETLADHISIMSRGEILCDGTAMELKRKYADGYVMKLLTTEAFEVAPLLALVQRHIPSAFTKSFVKPTISITLPYEHLNKYPAMLTNLEQHQHELGIVTISMTNATLEEVFLNCDPQKHMPEPSETVDQVDSSSYSALNMVDPQKNLHILGKQILAIIYKKAIFLRCYWIYLAVTIAILVGALALAYITINGSSGGDTTITDRAITFSFSPRTFDDAELLLNVQNGDVPKVQQFEQTLRAILQEHNVNVREWSTGALDELLVIERANITHYHERISGAIQVFGEDDRVSVKLLFTGNRVHGSAALLNLMDNVVVRLSSSQAEVLTSNAPIIKESHRVSSGGDFELYKVMMPLAFFVYMLFYVVLPFSEERSEFKKIQPISPHLLWATNYVFDGLVHTIVCVLVMAVHLLFDLEHQYFGVNEFAWLFAVYAFYGYAYLPILYIFAQILRSQSSLYSFLTYFFLIPNLCASFFTITENQLEKYSTVVSLLMVLPDFALKHSLSVMLMTFPNKDYWNGLTPLLGLKSFFIYMPAVTVVLMIFLVNVLEHIYRRAGLEWFFCLYQRLPGFRKATTATGTVEATAEVSRESDHTDSVVQANQVENYAIVVSKLSKRFQQFEAVRDISFTVKRGECFGLLGMNGAGKTTTFKMMTRDLTISSGNIFFNGICSTANPGQYKFMFGYCPQVDALNTFMTPYETVKFMAMVRGTALSEIDADVRQLLKNTDLESYTNVKVANLSGGTKRKLNTAMAMQSDPWLVFLDEPTTGVDPSSRRFMWSCIQECQKQNKNIVLTSHSMDECEFLCNRLAIMNSGQLNCIGPILELKKTFALGFLITVQIKPNQSTDSVASVKAAIQDSFVCALREDYGNQLCYLAGESHVLWSDVFQRMQSIERQFEAVVLGISISESSLEDIFLKIARKSLDSGVV